MHKTLNLIAFIDGSVYSQSICDHAAWIANRAEASVVIVHVLARRDVSSDATNLSGSIGLGARTALLEELAELDSRRAKLAQQRGRAILDGSRNRMREAGVQQLSVKLRFAEIVETAQELEQSADLIVIGKRGEAADFDTLHLGSNLERVVRSSKKPVLVASREFKPIQRLLIAFDGGSSALRAVDHIASSRVFAGLECQLLMVASKSTDNVRQIEGAAALLRSAGYTISSDIQQGQANIVITSKIETDNIDLLIMGAYGHSRIRNLIIGSTTTEMIRSCRIPVLLFR